MLFLTFFNSVLFLFLFYTLVDFFLEATQIQGTIAL